MSRVLAVHLAASIVAPTTLWAQDAAEEAADYYNQATLAYQQGDYKKAAELLDLAFGKNPDLVYKYNRILALQADGDHEKALAELNTMYAPMKADAQNRFDDIDQIKEQLEAAIAASEPDPDPDPEPGPDPVAPADSGPNYLAWGLIGGGAVALITGVTLATGVFVPGEVKECVGLGHSTADCENYWEELGGPDFIVEDDDAPPRPGTFADARDVADGVVSTHQTAAIVLMAGGAVLGAVGGILLVLDSGDESAETAQSVQLAPYVSHDGAGATFQFRF